MNEGVQTTLVGFAAITLFFGMIFAFASADNARILEAQENCTSAGMQFVEGHCIK